MLALAETLVSAFCHALGFNGNKRRPSVDVYELAERAGAEAVFEEELREDGRIEESPLATRIFLWSAPNESRRRFTLGHELGHLVLSDPKVFRLIQPEVGGERVRVEQLCDAFSAELLMPRKWLVKRYGGCDERLNVLYDIAEEAGVSFSAGLTRLGTVLDWDSSLLYLRNGEAAPEVLAGPLNLARVTVSKESIRQLQALPGSRKPIMKEIDLRLRGMNYRVSCELRTTRGGIMCLAPSPRASRRRLHQPA